MFALSTVKVLLFVLDELGSKHDDEVTGEVSKTEVITISSTETVSLMLSLPTHDKFRKNVDVLILNSIK